ncbi:hypothetical protein ILUMI_26682 [Ignelater luminosus]|uniref:tRNA (carboxymethyluridine(34)-5-O)-methyltransferase n=1 Tax=Ignelater luminosus TaxID=2038154 RepID=A0A8K0C7Z5_IGNLU|nr:hypothetical protein ILUMI_26682 [Ignelater luminosus]
MENINAIKDTRKLYRKVKKSQHIVEKQTGIRCIMNATKDIAICNAGLVNGLSEEVVFENFAKYGPLEKLIMLPGKSCAFVSFKMLESAMVAYNNINGKLNIAQDNKPLHLSYVEALPENLFNTPNYEEKPPGLFVVNDFITEDEEQLLLSLVTFNETENDSTSLKHRQVRHYGYEFRYDINNVDKNEPLLNKIPVECDFLWDRLKKCSDFKSFCPDQLTVNYYKPGQGIPPHVDTHSAFEDPLLSLSLGSSVVMDFRHDSGKHIPVFLPQRSLAIMSGESRYDWTHGITPRKMDITPSENGLTVVQRGTRTSFTFRKVLLGDCHCIYTNKCDSFIKKQKADEIKENLAIELEKTHVHNVYDTIADHFSDTRHKPWPNVLDFVQSLEIGSVLVDVGCGNGKYLGHNRNVFDLGCDSSASLINVCKTRGFQVFTCNCLNIPLRNNIADGIISIAVIHHLANSERRLQAIKELVRVLRINGKALIYVWAKDQNKNQEKSSYLKQDRKNRKSDSIISVDKTETIAINEDVSLPVHTNRTQFQHQDVLVPWKLKNGQKENDENENKLFLRFYHVFQEGELDELCKKLNNIEIIKSYYDQGNWCILLKKIGQ